MKSKEKMQWEIEEKLVEQIRLFINEHYQNEGLSLKEISEATNFSISHICIVFKGKTGSTLNQYITQYRMLKAKALLLNFPYKIIDIADMVGYSNGNYFGKSFKKIVGITPTEYRQKSVE